MRLTINSHIWESNLKSSSCWKILCFSDFFHQTIPPRRSIAHARTISQYDYTVWLSRVRGTTWDSWHTRNKLRDILPLMPWCQETLLVVFVIQFLAEPGDSICDTIISDSLWQYLWWCRSWQSRVIVFVIQFLAEPCYNNIFDTDLSGAVLWYLWCSY